MVKRTIYWYRDRSGLPRGPMTIDILKKCWINGIIDENTLMWGNGLGDWVPMRNVRGMAEVLHEPKTVFLKWLTQKVAFPKADRRARRQQLYEEGKAGSPPLDKEGVREWRRTREQNLVKGKEHMMLSLTLALPVPDEVCGGIGKRVSDAFGKLKAMKKKRGGEGLTAAAPGGEEEEKAGVRSA